MKCPNCNSEIEYGAKFCTHCGSNLSAPTEERDSASSYILFAWVIVTVVLGVANTLISNLASDWYNSRTMRPIMVVIFILQNLSLLLVPFAIKKKPLKVTAFVLIGLIVIYWMCSNIMLLTKDYYDF